MPVVLAPRPVRWFDDFYADRSPATCGHDKSNAVADCSCAYCLWRRGKNNVRDRRRRADVKLSTRSTDELRWEVMGHMGTEKFFAMETAMQEGP